MTDLQMGLIGLGAAGVAGVLVFNKWQEYRHRRLAEKVLSSRHTDVLLDQPVAAEADAPANEAIAPGAAPSLGNEEVMVESPASERIEPVLHFGEPDAERSETMAPPVRPGAPGFAQESTADEAGEPDDGGAVFAAPISDMPDPEALSPETDFIAAIEAVEPAADYQLNEVRNNLQARLHKPAHWYGYNEALHEWELITDRSGSNFRRFRIGLQLVDRKGPVSDSDLSVFSMAIKEFADELMAIAEMPRPAKALEIAAELDAFCASVDIQIGINVIAREMPFAGTKLRALAEAAGMVIDAEGRFVRCDDEGNVQYLLLNQENQPFASDTMRSMTSRGITFLLDVPRVGHGDRVFNQMVDQARRFADVLRGALVDDNRRPLSEEALEPIRRQVVQFQSTMAGRGLPAGTSLTQRLFS